MAARLELESLLRSAERLLRAWLTRVGWGRADGREQRKKRLLLAAGILGGLLLGGVGLDVALHSSLVAPEPTLLLLDRQGEYLADLGEESLGFWPVETLPRRVVEATRVLEDQRFAVHPGVDPLAAGRALWDNLRLGRRTSGASTLAMQVARLQRPGPRTFLKKTLEALTAVALTVRNGRESVLKHYLRIVPYGNRIHGIAFAARRYLDKPVEDLSDAEIAFLVSIPQSPAHMNPYTERGRARAIARGQHVLQRLAEEGILDATRLARAQEELRSLRFPPRPERPVTALHALLFLEQQLRRDERVRPFEGPSVDVEWPGPGGGAPLSSASGEMDTARGAPVMARTPLVRSTLALDLQLNVWLKTQALARMLEPEGVGNAAVLVVERPSMAVRAYVGSTHYFDRQRKGSIDYVQVPRLSGSILKPLLYAQALEQGVLSPDSILEDLSRTPEGVDNMDRLHLGPMLPRAALASSRNVPAVEVLRRVGLEAAYERLRRLGVLQERFPASHYGLSLAVGGVPVSLWDLLTATTPLLDDGRLRPLLLHDGVNNKLESPYYSEDTIRLITLYLSDPLARLPTFPRQGQVEYPFPVAIKTGTSSGFRDAWAVAWSRRWLVGVWMGHPDAVPMKRVTGYQSAARLVHELLLELHADQTGGLEDLGFPPPRGWRGHRLCPLSGEAAGEACDKVVLEYLPPDRPEPRPCAVHQRVRVDRRTGRLASPLTPRRFQEMRTVIQLPPRFLEWQVHSGLPFPPPEAEAGTRVGGEAPQSGQGLSTGEGVGKVPSWSAPPPHPALSPPKNGGEGKTHQTQGFSRILDRPVRLTIVAPTAGTRLLRDPEMPPEATTLSLRALAEPEVPELLWYVDGQPWALEPAPYSTRWPVTPGVHTFQVGIPLTPIRSKPVSVRIE